MSWKKYFVTVDKTSATSETFSPISGKEFSNKPGPAKSNYNSFLPDI